jgi:hypothetical protein
MSSNNQQAPQTLTNDMAQLPKRCELLIEGSFDYRQISDL